MEDVAASIKGSGQGKGARKGQIIVPDQSLYLPNVIAPTGQTYEEKARKEYNQAINEHLDEYRNFVPSRKVVVRCYVMEYYEEGGILQMPELEVHVRTANGVGHKETLKSPWPYSRKAVVVAVPDNYSLYKPGDIVLLERGTTLAIKHNTEVPFHLPKGFTVDSWDDLEPPHSMSSPHYGYLILEPLTDILGKKQ